MNDQRKPLWQSPQARARLAGASLAALAIGAAVGLTYVWPHRNGLDLDIDSSARAQEVRSREPYDLTQLTVMNRVILQVKDHYVDPERVSPQRMLLGGLNAVQQTVAPVLVHYEDGGNEVGVTVYGASRNFRVDDVTSPWALSYRWREIFGFLQANLRDEDVELRDIEYAAINGMLRTLDPHSVLLDPETYTEMQMSTRGEFGGLGIVISIRDGQLTIIRPMPETPASRAGLNRMDRIVRIGEESTLNMPLEDAVSRLRGPPGSNVQVWVTREGQGGWSTPRPFTLTRAVIHIESVESRMLEGNIGYISINSFQGNTFEDMTRALAQLHAQGMRGLVLDLRDDPGGLLDQAVRVADAFLDNGIIVTTSSSDPSQRDERSARREGTEPEYPMIVLVNGGSASASEIVAGALKNHDRALVVGQRTFGKGSVQVLYNYDDGSALKLTIAQYLTPGDVSIQGVGIVPDIAIDPMTVDRTDLDLEVDQGYVREADLDQHLTNTSARDGEESAVVMRYYLPVETRERLREARPEDQEENEQEDEFLLRFAREVLVHSTREGAPRRGNRRQMIEDATPVIERLRGQELSTAARELERLGVNWDEGTDQGASPVQVEVTTNAPENRITAGENLELRVRVTNTGSAPLYRLRAQTRSDFALFNHRELVFGRLDPGQTREWSTTLGICTTENERRTCVVPREVPDRADGIRVEFSEAHGHAPPSTEIRTQIRALPRPQFAYQVQVADDVRGNGDGLVQRGETASVYLRVRNTGQGRTYETQANLQSRAGQGVLLHAGRFELESIPPGEERLIHFTFEVLPDFERDSVRLEARVADVSLRELMVERVDVPIAPSGAAPTPRRGRVTLRDGAAVRERPAADSQTLARVEGGAASLPAQAELSGFVRVDLGEGRPGWVASSDVTTDRAASGARVTPLMDHMPPRIDVEGVAGMLTTTADRVPIRAIVRDDLQVRDAYVFVGTRKVFYVSNRDATDPREVRFDTEVPLRPGVNVVIVVARENDEVLSRRTFIVRRDAPDGTLMETPRTGDDWFHLGIEGEEGEE
ncbi:MXAN_5808 family serine peptidase [Sandaracinus amylolyticus]|uniref:MXAN_5808 family serine peptidase n=1 Tax=Sandaracinus amylolyticus TaxID=927083 RepID=UPI00069F44CA|nr:MXAN_5808 family serine peptidase [Sandaracinus amylolyticus]